MGEEKPFPSKRLAPPRAAASWEDVGSDRTFRWKRRPLGPLVDNCGRRPGEQHVTPAVASFPGVDPPTGDDPSWASGKGPATPRGRVQGNGPQAGDGRDFRGLAFKAEGNRAAGRETLDGPAAWQQQQQQQQQQHLPGRGGVQGLQQEGVVVIGGAGPDNREEEASERSSSTDLDFRPHTHDRIDHIDIDIIGAAARSGGHAEARAGGGGAGRNGSNRVRGFHDMICVGFAVSLCLNLGSLTARREGFFAAEVQCLPEGAAQTVLPDLGIWVGWRQAVANDQEAAVLNLEDLSMVGAVMGVLTVVGHATDALLNAVGLAVLVYGRRKPLQEAMCRLVKRLCLASLAMAGWLMGMTIIGFLAAVKGPIGAAAVAFYSDLSLYCRSSVSVSVDYAYAMTALTVLCQFFIGVVALPTPSLSSSRGHSSSDRGRCCNRRWGCRSINPVGWCWFFVYRTRSCCCRRCFPSTSPSSAFSASDDEPPGFSDVGPSSGMGAACEAAPAARGDSKSRGSVAGTGRAEEARATRLEHV